MSNMQGQIFDTLEEGEFKMPIEDCIKDWSVEYVTSSISTNTN